MPPRQLAALLDDGRTAVRARAIEQLGRRGESAVPDIAARQRASGPVTARLNAVWALTRIDGDAARAAVRAALDDPDSTVRQAAAHSAGSVARRRRARAAGPGADVGQSRALAQRRRSLGPSQRSGGDRRAGEDRGRRGSRADPFGHLRADRDRESVRNARRRASGRVRRVAPRRADCGRSDGGQQPDRRGHPPAARGGRRADSRDRVVDCHAAPVMGQCARAALPPPARRAGRARRAHRARSPARPVRDRPGGAIAAGGHGRTRNGNGRSPQRVVGDGNRREGQPESAALAMDSGAGAGGPGFQR